MPVHLPPAFQFSQSSLQNFMDCARRFQLRYLMEQDWPAPVAEPIGDAEQADVLGKRFHKLIERHYLGIRVGSEQLEPVLQQWWEAFLRFPIPNLPSVCRPEVHTSALIHGQRIVGTFDLLAYTPHGEAVIVDWKTTQRRSSREWLDRRLQTILYPLLLVESSERLLGYKIKPEQVRLAYWFANAPADIEVFQYSILRYEQDHKMLGLLLNNLLNTDDQVWPLTPDVSQCRICQYRSLCDRGHVAGSVDEIDVEVITLTTPADTDDFVL